MVLFTLKGMNSFGDKAWITIAIASRFDGKLPSDVSRIVKMPLLCCPCPKRAPWFHEPVLRSCNPPSSSWNMLGHLVWCGWLVDLARRPYMKQVCVHLDVSGNGVHIPFSDKPISSYFTPSPFSVFQRWKCRGPRTSGYHNVVTKGTLCNPQMWKLF
jgi:hypothetical protein